MGVVDQSPLLGKPLEGGHQLRGAGGTPLWHGGGAQKPLAVPAVIEVFRLTQTFLHSRDLDLLVFRNIRGADAEGGPDARVLIGLYHRVDVGEIGHFVDGRHAVAQALQAAQQDAVIPFLGREGPLNGKHFLQPLGDVQIVERAFGQTLYHMSVDVRHARKQQHTLRVERLALRGELRRNCREASVLDQKIGGRCCQRVEIRQKSVLDQQHSSASAAAANRRRFPLSESARRSPVA